MIWIYFGGFAWIVGFIVFVGLCATDEIGGK